MLLIHNWDSDLKIKLSYETKIFESFFKKEQRRALRTEPRIEVSKNILCESQDAKEILGRNFNTTFYVPLDMEFFLGARGSKKIVASTDISAFFFLNNLSGLYIISEDEYTSKIVSVIGTSINLESTIEGASNNFYTAIKVFIKNIDFQYESDGIVSTNIIFQQVKE